MHWVRIAILAALAITLAACMPAKPASPMATATRARIVGAPNADLMSVEHDGRVHATSISKSGAEVPYPVTDGGWLTDKEFREVLSAVHFTKPPDAIAGCCFPRHAVLFYDAHGHYLGYLSICFECGCADMWPYNPPRKDESWIDWDGEVFERIVTAHKLTPIAPSIKESSIPPAIAGG